MHGMYDGYVTEMHGNELPRGHGLSKFKSYPRYQEKRPRNLGSGAVSVRFDQPS